MALLTLPVSNISTLAAPNEYVVANLQAAHMSGASLSSQRIIETASYTTTPSHTPPVLRGRPRISGYDHYRNGPSTEAILHVKKALESFVYKEKRLLDSKSGNYQRAVAAKELNQIHMRPSPSDDKLRKSAHRGRSCRPEGDIELCCWSHEDLKRKRHLEMISGVDACQNCQYSFAGIEKSAV